MGNTTNQIADRLHLLCLMKLLFQPFQFRNILLGEGIPEDMAKGFAVKAIEDKECSFYNPLTLDEFFESLVLIQTLKQAFFPVVLMGTDFWKGLIDWIKLTMLESNTYVSPEDMDVFALADDPKEAVRIIVDFKESNPRPGLDLPPGMKMVTNPGGP